MVIELKETRKRGLTEIMGITPDVRLFVFTAGRRLVKPGRLIVPGPRRGRGLVSLSFS